MTPDGILETCIYVDDLAAAREFYTSVVGAEFVSEVEGRHVFFRCGRNMLLIFDANESDDPEGDLPPHGTHGAGHIAFATAEAELAAWRERLTRHNVPIEQEFQWPQGGTSLYFRDPAGNSLEFVTPRIWGLEEYP